METLVRDVSAARNNNKNRKTKPKAIEI